MVDEVLAAAARCFCDRLLRLALGADEQDLAARTCRGGDEIESACKQGHRLRQVDDVNTVTRAENIRLHARIPAVGLVAEMGSGFDQLLH